MQLSGFPAWALFAHATTALLLLLLGLGHSGGGCYKFRSSQERPGLGRGPESRSLSHPLPSLRGCTGTLADPLSSALVTAPLHLLSMWAPQQGQGHCVELLHGGELLHARALQMGTAGAIVPVIQPGYPSHC